MHRRRVHGAAKLRVARQAPLETRLDDAVGLRSTVLVVAAVKLIVRPIFRVRGVHCWAGPEVRGMHVHGVLCGVLARTTPSMLAIAPPAAVCMPVAVCIAMVRISAVIRWMTSVMPKPAWAGMIAIAQRMHARARRASPVAMPWAEAAAAAAAALALVAAAAAAMVRWRQCWPWHWAANSRSCNVWLAAHVSTGCHSCCSFGRRIVIR